MATAFLYDARFLDHDTGAGHPESPARLSTALAVVERLPWYPELRQITASPAELDWIETTHLSSISVSIDDDRESTFYKGRLAEGVALFDPFMVSAGRVGMVEEGSLPLLAGLSPDIPSEQSRSPAKGLVLYGERNPKPGKPSRVTRRTVFLPESPGDVAQEEAGD